MRFRGAFVLPLLVGACVGDAATTVNDASTPVDSGADAVVFDAKSDAVVDASVPTCDLQKAFGTPQLVAGVNSGKGDYTARLSADELTLYLAVEVPADAFAGEDIYIATRPTRQSAFGKPAPLANANTTGREGGPSTTGDGLTLVLNSNRNGGFDLFLATRQSPLQDFTTPATISGVNSNVDDFDAFIAWDGSELDFGSLRLGSADLFRAVKSGQTFGTPTPIAELNTAGAEDCPVLSEDRLTIFWYSSRTDLGGKAGGDIFTAHRSATTQPFTDLKNVTEVNSDSSENPTWLSEDGCRLYLQSDRPGSSQSDIYVAERPL